MKKILLVGAGQMGMALYEGWKKSWDYDVLLIDPNKEGESNVYSSLDKLIMNISSLNQPYIPDYVVFAVKPQILCSVAPLYNQFSADKTLFVSIVAGVSTATMKDCLGAEALCVRVMPNLPATVQCGLAGIYTPDRLSPAQRVSVLELFHAVGEAFWVSTEDQIDQITALSGSGPAYVFRLMEAMMATGRNRGFSKEEASMIAYQTFRGAIHLLEKGGISKGLEETIIDWRKRVTSPGGTTEAGLKVFEEENIDQVFDKVVSAAYMRAKELEKR